VQQFARDERFRQKRKSEGYVKCSPSLAKALG
jgi:hypothetical protein